MKRGAGLEWGQRDKENNKLQKQDGQRKQKPEITLQDNGEHGCFDYNRLAKTEMQ